MCWAFRPAHLKSVFFKFLLYLSMQNQKQVRKVDLYFEKYAESHQNMTNEIIHWICVPLIVFSLFGLIRAIPFPYIGFLGKYNGYLNFASFLIAYSIYFYYKLSPVLSYAMLIIMMIFSTGIVSLEKLQKTAGWPEMWQVCLGIFVLSWIGQFIGHKIEGKKPSSLR